MLVENVIVGLAKKPVEEATAGPQNLVGFFINFNYCTLLVLIDFCPVKSEFLTLGFVYKNF